MKISAKWAVLLFCLINSRHLMNVPYLTQLTFLIWLLPIAVLYFTDQKPSKDQTLIFIIAFTLSFFGWIIELKILKDFALALALLALIPWSLYSGVWWIVAALWIPSFGWFFSGTFLQEPYTKILICTLLTIPFCFIERKYE